MLIKRHLISAISIAIALSALVAWAQTEKKAYVLVQVDVTNAQQYGEYTKLSPGIIEKFGGRFLARGGVQFVLVEGM